MRLFRHMNDCVDACQCEGRRQKSETEADSIATPSAFIDERSPNIFGAGLLASRKKCDEDDEEQNAAINQSVVSKYMRRGHTHAEHQP